MQTKTIAPVLALSAVLAAGPALAGETDTTPQTKTRIGVVAGGILGAVFGGPPGAIAGAALGAYATDRTVQAQRVGPLTSRVETLESQRDELRARREQLDAEVARLAEALESEREALARARDGATVADGLEFAIPFRTASAQPPEEAVRGLDALAILLGAAPELVLHLDGYADPRGGEDYNAGLSMARAEAVRDYLVSAGVGPERIIVTGHGELDRATPNDPEAWAMQRRVSVRLQLSEDRLASRP
jgi:outer membrane protein OmpA-like peptidoglycan-associated protein